MKRRVTTIILAAGTSSRFGMQNKLLHDLGGVTVIETTVHRAAASPVNEVIVVTGFQKAEIETLVDSMSVEGMSVESVNVRSVFNPDFESGMASSIVCGVSTVAPDHDFLIWPGDMPMVMPETVAGVVRRGIHSGIVVPVFESQRGHPVFFGRSFREELLHLEGDRGARSILGRHPESVVEVVVEDSGIVFDIDAEDDLRVASEILSRRI